MYRKIFTPSEQNSSIPFTILQEDAQQQVSVEQSRRKKREELLDKYLIDLSGFKFNRDEANDYGL
jgi:hypothetical protein